MKRWREVSAWLAALLAILIAVGLFKASYLPALPARGDALYDAIVAKRLLAGDGFRTNLMPLGGLGVLQKAGLIGELPWPSVHKFVASQIRVAIHLVLFRDTVTSLRAASMIPYAGLAALLFLSLRRWLRSAPVAFLFSAAFLTLNELFYFALSGLSVTTDTLIFLGIVLLMLSAHVNRWAAPALGLMVTLAVLHRYSVSLLVPFCIVGVTWSAGWRRGLVVAAPSVLILGAFVVWSKARFGLTFPSYLGESLLLHRTRYLPYDPWYAFDWPVARTVVLSDPGTFVAKFLVSMQLVWDTFAAGPAEVVRNVALVFFAVIGAKRLSLSGRPVKRAVITIVAFSLFFSAVQLTLGAALWYLDYLVPPLWMLGALGAVVAVGRVGRRVHALKRARPRMVAIAACAIVLATPEIGKAYADRVGLALSGHRCQADELCTRGEVLSVLERTLERQTILMGGMKPWDLASDTSARVIPAVPRPEDLLSLRETGVTIGAVYLPTEPVFAGNGDRPDEWYKWQRIVRQSPERFFDYALKHRFSDGALLYVQDHSLDTSFPLPECLSGPLDLRRPIDLLALSNEFAYRESYEGRAWSWLHGTTGRARLDVCQEPDATRVKVVHIGTPKNGMSLSVNGTSLGTVRWDAEGWHDSVFTLPPGIARRGSNEILITADNVSIFGISVAIESITLE